MKVSNASSSVDVLYKHLGVKDKNRNGVIDNTGWKFWRSEGYKKEIDINLDGTISISEAKAFLYYTKNNAINNAAKQFPLTETDKAQLESFFREAIKNAKTIENTIKRQDLLSVISEKMIKIGLYDEVILLASQPEEDSFGEAIIKNLFGEMGKKKQFGYAAELVEKISGEKNQYIALEIIFQQMAKDKNYNQAFEIAGTKLSRGLMGSAIRILCRDMTKAGLYKKAEQIIISSNEKSFPSSTMQAFALKILADEMKNKGIADANVKDVLVKSFNRALENLSEYDVINEIMADMSGLFTFKELITIAEKKIKDPTSISKFIDSIDRDILIKNYLVAIPFLIKTLGRRVEEVNGWNNWWNENYFRPTYEAAATIGHIAKAARAEGNKQVLQHIVKTALPKIVNLLKFENPRPGIDYGYVYILYPMRRAVLQALVDIGDASAIKNIEKCGSINYRSPYKESERDRYTIKPEKQEAIRYLKMQKASSSFIEPPHLDTSELNEYMDGR